MKIPQDYFQRVYAGWLGKIIGIRLGAPIEGWTYEKIRSAYGELDGYPVQYRQFAADDDSNGPLFFVRALEDCQDLSAFSSQDVAEALLNYAPYEHGFFWWGGYGVSTEHTAYLNLRAGIPAPRSGSVEQNGSTMAEQIGGQIFIDPWGLVAPGNPDLAASLAEKAAGVTHGGNGVYGGIFVACCISLAFVEADIHAVMDKALAYIPAGCQYARVVNAVRDFHAAHPDDWRACFQYVHDCFGYDKYPGACHIIPNAGVMVLAMCYGGGDFARTLNICNMCGWDTDCNVGNVGCIMGVLRGVEGIPARLREPINDFLAASSVIGSLNATDLPYGASYFARQACRLAGEHPPAPWREVLEDLDRLDRCHFEYPGSTHAIRGRCPGGYRLMNTDEQAHSGRRSLKLLVLGGGPGTENFFYKQTYYHPQDFDDDRYNPSFSPLLYPGQTVRMHVLVPPADGVEAAVQAYARFRDGELVRGEKRRADGSWQELSVAIPSGSRLVEEAGFILSLTGRLGPQDMAAAYLDDLVFEGKPDYQVDFRQEEMERWSPICENVAQFSRLKGHAYLQDGWLNLSCGDFGELYTGRHDWTDYTFGGDLRPVTGERCYLNVRVQGAMRSYRAGFDGQRLVLDKNRNGYCRLCEAPFQWKPGEVYRVQISAQGGRLTVSVDGRALLDYTDTDRPILRGGVGVSVADGSHGQFGNLDVTTPASQK